MNTMKKCIKFIFLCILLVSILGSAALAADPGDAVRAAETTADVAERIEGVKSTYLPSYAYFVSRSAQAWVGYDDHSGDLTKPCTDLYAGNSHGRFGGLWQSSGFGRFVFHQIFGTYAAYDYHCNPASINDNVILIGRYGSNCAASRGSFDGPVTAENMKSLFSQAKKGDLIVLAPRGLCKLTGTTMVFLEATESEVKVYQADYTGACVVTEDTIPYSTLASYHCVSLLRASNYPTVDYLAPNEVVNLKLSAEKIPSGENITVSWLDAKYAAQYRITLRNEHGIVDTMTTTETTYVLSDLVPGTYQVQVEAWNDKGLSDAAVSPSFTVYPMLSVSFVDHDGTLITLQKVPYGGDATAPSIPDRVGHKFAGWDSGLKNITADTTITALYELEKYTVSFYSVGKANRLGSQQVSYGHAAVPPEYDETTNNFGLSEGFVFSGWHIEFGSDGTDYNRVDGDMNIIATQSWDRSSLPVSISLYKAELQEDGKTYRLNGDLSNTKEEPISCKLIAVMKTAEGKTVKCSIMDEYTLEPLSTYSIDDTLVYSEKITSIEYYAVIIRDNDKTGGICAAPASVGITAETTWGNWTEWTDVLEEGHAATEEKIQYRYRNKLTTTSATKNLAEPWSFSHETFEWSAYSGWSGWSTSAPAASDSVYVESRRAYLWFYYACPYCGGHSYYNQHFGWAGGCGKWISDQYYRTTWGAATYASGKDFGGSGRFYTDNTDAGRAYCWKAWHNGTGGTVQTQYRYKTRSPIYTYHYWMWDEWSEWSDVYMPGDEVEQRTIYRYRDKVELSDPNAGTEDNSGNEYSLSGAVQLSDAPSTLDGRNATVMVYKKTNSDPTEAQLEYVGQTVIGEGNSYDISFRPKENPSEETGDFIVSLGIEGCDKLVNIGVIHPEGITHTVRFYVDGEVYAEQEVARGSSAVLPAPPQKDGYIFLKWSETATCVSFDMVVNAVFQPVPHTVTFVDWETGDVFTQNYLHGETIAYPVLPTVSGASSRVWDKQTAGVFIATESMVVESVTQWKNCTVTFKDGDTVISTQTVTYGQSAAVPGTEPAREGMIFSWWRGSNGCTVEKIVDNCTFTPVFVNENTAAAPEAEVRDNGDGTSTVSLSCATEGSNIYYVIENGKVGAETPSELAFLQEASAVRLDLLQAQLVDRYYENSAELMNGDWSSGNLDSGWDIIITPGFGGFDEVFGATGPMEEDYSFMDKATKYTGGEIVLQEGQSIVFLSTAEGMNDSAPQVVSGENAEPNYTVSLGESSLRQYRSTVEGSVGLTITGGTPAFTECQITLTLYDEQGLLVDLIPLTRIVAPGENEIRFDNVVVPTERACSKAKIMVWLTEGDVTPVVGVHTLAIN